MNRHNHLLIILFALFWLINCAPDKSAPTRSDPQDIEPTVEPEAINWLQNNAVPVYSANPGGGFSDIASLNSIVGDAKIVAIGNSVYGNHESILMKHRLLEYFIKEMEFNIFAFPTDFPESELMDNYFQSGVGDLGSLYYNLILWRQLFKNNNVLLLSEDLLNMFAWLESYNRQATQEKKVKFCGFNVQRPQQAMINVIEYLSGIDSTTASYVDSLYSRFQSFCWKYPNVSNYVMNQCRDYVKTVRDTMQNRRTIYEQLSSPDDYERALFFAQYVVRAEQVLRKNTENLQKEYIIDMITYILDQSEPNSKMVIWDHNLQIGNYEKGFGKLLKSEFGQDFVSIGLCLNKGYFYASIPNPDDGSYSWPCLLELPNPPANSYEMYFQSAEIPMFLLDIKSNLSPPGSPETVWLYGPRKNVNIEYFYEPNKAELYFKETNLTEIYDVIIYLHETTESELLIY